MTSDQATFLLETSLPALKNEYRTTKNVIAAIPLDKGDYRPDEISKSALDLAWHIVATENRFLDAVLTGAFDLTPNPRPDSVKTSADLLALYQQDFEPRFEKLSQLGPETLLTIVDFRGLFQHTGSDVSALRDAPHRPPSRPVVDVSAADGREGAVDLRRKLRRRAGSHGVAAERVTCAACCHSSLQSPLFAADAKYDGARVHYESYGKGKEAVVFVHGWTCDLTFWRGQAAVYEKHRALLVDLPGHGQSDKPDVSYTQERFARAIEAVMKDAHVDRAVLVGHSMGGPVALTFLRLFPAKTKAIVFVDAYVPQAPKDAAEKAAQAARMAPFLKSLQEPNYRDVTQKMIEGMFSDKTTPAMREEIRSKMGVTPQHVLASAMEGMFAVEPFRPAESYNIPAMAIVATLRPGDEAQLRAVFPNLRKYEAWPGSGHFLMMESPDRFNAALEQFLSSIEPRH